MVPSSRKSAKSPFLTISTETTKLSMAMNFVKQGNVVGFNFMKEFWTKRGERGLFFVDNDLGL